MNIIMVVMFFSIPNFMAYNVEPRLCEAWLLLGGTFGDMTWDIGGYLGDI